MKLNDYIEYIRNPLADAKARVVIVPPGEGWTTLRRFYQERGNFELRLSDLVRENAWLPMPDEVFERVSETTKAQAGSDKALVLLGLPGYLALLTDENKRAAIIALREWLDRETAQEAVCLLQSDDCTRQILKEVFNNPRYRQGKQLIEINFEEVAPEEAERNIARTEVMLVGEHLASFIPVTCETFQKYLRYTEEYPNDSSLRRIVVASEGRQLAGLSAEVRQVVSLRDFARVFYDVEETRLSEDALRWMCERGREGAGKTLSEMLKTFFFPEGDVNKRILNVFDRCDGAEREAVLWLIKRIASKESYLESVVSQDEVIACNFRSAYVTGAAEWLDKAAAYANERRDAIQVAGVIMSDADIRQFILHCTRESTSRIVPWLNCGTDIEHAELLRRCAADGLVSNAVKDVYPEVRAYLNTEPVFCEEDLESYFREYRNLKTTSHVTQDFYERAQRTFSTSSVQSRDAIVQRYTSDNGCALLVVDAMGAEWLPMLVALARERNLGVDSVTTGEVNLPTSTEFNNIYWPDPARRLSEIKRLDNIVHNGEEEHEERRAEENLSAELDVIGSEVLPRVAEALTRFERVLVTADHGSSRLALLAWQAEPRLARTLPCEDDAEVADWRYRERPVQGGCPPELEETLDGKHWVVRGYNRLSKKSGRQRFELHGGATREERLVPVVIFSKTGQFTPTVRSRSKRAQIIEKEEFDL